MATDRKILKDQQVGALVTAPAIVDPKAAVKAAHTRSRDFKHTGTENADTNVAEIAVVPYLHRAVKVRGIGIAASAQVTANATNYAVIKFYGRLNGTSTLVGSWNTHTSAQGALETSSPSLLGVGTGLVVNADSDVAAGSSLTMVITKVATGRDIDTGTLFSFDLEEV